MVAKRERKGEKAISLFSIVYFLEFEIVVDIILIYY